MSDDTFVSMSIVRARDFDKILPDKDMLTKIEENIPGLKQALISRMNKYSVYLSEGRNIVDVKYVKCKHLLYDGIYLTKEEQDSELIYLEYIIAEGPINLCLRDFIDKLSIGQLERAVCAKDYSNIEENVQKFISNYFAGIYTCEQYDSLITRKIYTDYK